MSERDPNKDIRPWVTIGEAVNEMLVKTADAYADPGAVAVGRNSEKAKAK